jgi:hypothetical protein
MLLQTPVIILGIALAGAAYAQNATPLPDYVSLLPQVKAKAPVIDPHKGYVVRS